MQRPMPQPPLPMQQSPTIALRGIRRPSRQPNRHDGVLLKTPTLPARDHLALTRKPMIVYPMRWKLTPLELPHVVPVTVKQRQARSKEGLLRDVPLKKPYDLGKRIDFEDKAEKLGDGKHSKAVDYEGMARRGVLCKATATAWGSEKAPEVFSDGIHTVIGDVRFPKIDCALPAVAVSCWAREMKSEGMLGVSKRCDRDVGFPKVDSGEPSTSLYSLAFQGKLCNNFPSKTENTELCPGSAKLAEDFRNFLADLTAKEKLEKCFGSGQLAATDCKQSLAKEVPALPETTVLLNASQKILFNFDEWFDKEFPNSSEFLFGDNCGACILEDKGCEDVSDGRKRNPNKSENSTKVDLHKPAAAESGEKKVSAVVNREMKEISVEPTTADKLEKSRKRSRENSSSDTKIGGTPEENQLSQSVVSQNASENPPKKSREKSSCKTLTDDAQLLEKSSGSEPRKIDTESGSLADVPIIPKAASWLIAEWKIPSNECDIGKDLRAISEKATASQHLRDILTHMKEVIMYREQVESQDELDEVENELQLDFQECFKQYLQKYGVSPEFVL